MSQGPIPDRREFLGAAVPIAIGAIAAQATSPPPPKAGGDLKPIAANETLPLPTGATARLGSPRMRIHGYVNRVQFSPKGNTLVGASSSEIRAWDPQTSKVLFRVGYPENASVDAGRLTSRDTFALLVRPNTGGQYEIHHYAFGSGKLVAKSPLPDVNQTQQTAFTTDGTLLAVVRQEVLLLIDAATGKEKWRETLPAESTGDLAFFPSAATLALAAKGGVKLFSVGTGKLESTLKIADTSADKEGGNGNRGRNWLQNLVISADGRWLATSVGEDGDVVRCWEVKTGKVKSTYKPASRPVAFTPDGNELLTYKDGVATFWNLADGKSRKFDVPSDDDLCLSPDGKVLACAADDAVILIDPKNGQRLPHSADPPGLPAALTFRGSRLIGRLDGWNGWAEWSTATAPPKLIRPPEIRGVKAVSLSRDGERALFRKDSAYSLREVSTGRVVTTLDTSAPPDGGESAILTPDGRTLLTWETDGLIVKGPDGKETRRISRPGVSGQIGALAVSANGARAAIGLNNNEKGGVEILDLTTEKPIRSIELTGAVRRMAFSSDGDWLAVAHDSRDMGDRFGNQSAAAVYESATGNAILRVPPDEYRDPVMAISADGRVLARIDSEKSIALWEVLSGTIRAKLIAGGAVTALAFSADGRTLAACVQGAPIFLWDFHAGPRPPVPNRAALEQAWSEFLKPDGIKAFAAIKLFAAHADKAAPFLREVLPPTAPADEELVTKHIGNLDDRDFRKREIASRALAALGDRASGALKKAASTPLSPETRERVERLLAAGGRPTPEFVRMMRAIEAMEAAGAPEATKLLEHWSTGAAGSMFTLNAQAAARRVIERMEK